MHGTKISPDFECQLQKSKAKVTRDKNEKKCGILLGSCPIVRGPGAAFFSGAVLGSAVHYAGGKISACCVVLCNVFARHS